MKIRLWERS